jgi:hypothetical protein
LKLSLSLGGDRLKPGIPCSRQGFSAAYAELTLTHSELAITRVS